MYKQVDGVAKIIQHLRKQQPLVLNLTNVVTMDFVANCLLAVGAAPIMSLCEEELEELVALSSALYINIGTLDASFIRLAQHAVACATKLRKPIILDPVGAGATRIRSEIAHSLMPHATIIRGNASEIMALGKASFSTKGVEAICGTEEAEGIAVRLAKEMKSVVVVSGAVDVITDGERVERCAHGSAMMKTVTGMGCSMTAIIAAVRAVLDDSFEAARIGTTYVGLCGEMASQHHKSPASFKSTFIDLLYSGDLLHENVPYTSLG